VTANLPATQRPDASAKAATHLAEIDALYDVHVAALREHAVLVQAAVGNDAHELAERAEPDPSRH
jgi:hypothetical protein